MEHKAAASFILQIILLTETIFIALAVTLRILSNPVANVFQKQLTNRGNHPLVVNFLTYLALAIVCLFFLRLVPWKELGTQFWLFSLLGGLVGALGNGFLVKALQKGDLSVLGPINSYKSVVGIIVGIFLLGEIPNSWGIVGIALIIYGSYFVLDTTEEKFSLALFKRPEIQFRLWAMILTAIEAVFVKKVILASSVSLALMSWCILGAFFSFILLLLNGVSPRGEFEKISGKDLSSYALLVACIGTMQFTTNYAFDHMPVGYVLSLFQLSTIISVLVGYRIFKEQDVRKKLVGSTIMIIGSVLIILLKNG
ncbi:MAG: EamA family transporter [Bacteroidota bacterium]